MSGTVVYEVTGQDFANVAKVMRASAPELAKLMRREIRTVAKPVLDKQRQQIAAVGMTASGYDGSLSGVGGGTGLRASIARATRLYTSGRAGVRIQVSPGALGNRAKIPAYVDAGQPWRHPIFGNRRLWVQQQATGDGWFTKTGLREHPRIKADVNKIIIRYATQLAARL